jgi:catechol 2,3-dioxygenase-like lactoylglutathione lyase family enzyme
MEGSRQPIAFLATAHAEQALHFYQDILGLTLLEDSPFALVFSDAAQMLRVQKVRDHSPAPHTVHGWQVSDIEAEIRQLASRGAQFIRYEHLDQCPLAIWTSPDGNKVAWFKDPSGNNLSLTQFA